MTAALPHKLYVLRGNVIHASDNPGDVIAHVDQRNPLSPAWRIPAQVAENQRLVIWSGTLGDDLFQSDPRNWMAGGRSALDSFCGRIASELEQRDIRLAIRPHARHVLSDGLSTRRFFDDHADSPFELALDPAAMLEPSMAHAVEEHLERIFEMLGIRAAMVFLDEADNQVAVLRRLIAEHIPATTPIILQKNGV